MCVHKTNLQSIIYDYIPTAAVVSEIMMTCNIDT